MRKTAFTIILFLFLFNLSFAQNNQCSRETNFGEKELCLPEVEGYKECYEEPNVKQLADATEVPANRVIGYYLNDQTYGKRDSLGLISFDDFFKIYGTLQIQDLDADKNFLEEMETLLGGNFISKNWEQMEKEVDKIGIEVEVGVPIIVKQYKLNERSFTFLMLTKYALEGIEPYTLAISINGLLINDRVIWMAYYLNYKGEETIISLANKSNDIVRKLLKVN
jgi:hypothetical protein